MSPSNPALPIGWPASWDWPINDSVSSAIGAVGGAAAVLLFLSPLATFIQIVREKSTGSYSAFPYVISLIQCELWVVYCFLTPHMKTAPLFTNVLGIILEAAYVCIWFAFSPQAARRRTAALLVCMTLVVAGYSYGVLAVFPDMPTRSTAIGALGDVFNGEVIRTKSVACMPLALSVAGLFCGSVWLAFSIYVRNVIVFLPNVCGVILGIAQLGLYAAYRRGGAGPALTADDDAEGAEGAADAKAQLKEPLLQRSTSAGGGLREDTGANASYSLLAGTGGGGGGSRVGGGAAEADRAASEALAAAALAWKGGQQKQQLAAPAKLDASAA